MWNSLSWSRHTNHSFFSLWICFAGLAVTSKPSSQPNWLKVLTHCNQRQFFHKRETRGHDLRDNFRESLRALPCISTRSSLISISPYASSINSWNEHAWTYWADSDTCFCMPYTHVILILWLCQEAVFSTADSQPCIYQANLCEEIQGQGLVCFIGRQCSHLLESNVMCMGCI